MTIPTVTDQLWELMEPLLPHHPRRFRSPGRRRLDNRQVLNGILYVLATGIAWEQLPQQLGYGSGMTSPGEARHMARGSAGYGG